MLKLLVVVTSTREARVGHLIADWAMEQVRAHGKFEPELADLKAVGLPVLDEPNHPRLRPVQARAHQGLERHGGGR